MIPYKPDSEPTIMHRRTSSPQRLWFWTITASVTYLLLQLLEDRLLGTHYSTWLFAAFIMGFAIVTGRQQRSLLYMVVGVTAGLLAWHYELAMHHDTVFTPRSWTAHLIAFGVLLLFSMPAALLRRKRTRSWHTWLFASAMRDAESGGNGSSDRTGERHDEHAAPVDRHTPAAGEYAKPSATPPRTEERKDDVSNALCFVRTVRYSDEELRKFSSFLSRRRIAVPEWEDDTLVLYFPGVQHLFRDDYHDRPDMTRAILPPSGKIAVHISREDYVPYRDHCGYENLCRGVGSAVYDLLQRCRHDEKDLILREVKDDTRAATAVLIVVGLLVLTLSLLLYLDMI